MKSFLEILPKTLKIIRIDKRFYAENVIFYWRKLVGEEIYAHTRAIKISHGELTVRVNNNVWAHHLMTMKQNLIKKINDFVGEKVVSDIRFQAGYLKNDQNQENTGKSDEYPPNLKDIVISEEEVRSAEKIADNLSNNKLRLKYRQIMIKNAALQEFRKKQNWHNCQSCGVLCPPEKDLCTICALEAKVKNIDKIRKILMQAPFINCHELNNYVKCTPYEFKRIKYELIDDIINDIKNSTSDQLQVGLYLMLARNIKPQEITEEIIVETMNKIRGKKNVFTPRR